MDLQEELERIAEAARAYAADSEEVAAVIPAEPSAGLLVYLCAFTAEADRSWLALDADGEPVSDRALIHDAVSIAALCELADEAADADTALVGPEHAVERPLRVASPAYLDAIGASARSRELALGGSASSPFAAAMKQASMAVDGLAMEVEASYKVPLS